MNVTLPDGTVINDVPDGTTKIQLLAKLHQNGYDIRPLIAAENQNPANRPDPTAGMSGTEKFLAGAGKAFTDIARGAGQIAGIVSPEDIAQSRQEDAPLMKTGAGVAGNLTGNIAAFAPTAFIPGANTYTGAALLGAGMGALAPTTQDESRAFNMAAGGLSGIGGTAAGRGIGNILRPVKASLTPEMGDLATAAQNAGIPLRASQVTGSKPLAIAESVMENLPMTSANQLSQKAAQKAAYNSAVLQRAGIAAEKATPDVLAAQKAALGSTFEDIASRNSIDFNKGVTNSLSDIADQASRRLSHPEPITNTIDDILQDVDKNGLMNGAKYQGWRSTLGQMSKGGDTEAHYASQVKKALDQAFNSQISGADQEAWKTASTQYGNLKNIMQAMGGPGIEPIAGNISPAQLSAALTRQVGKEGKALGRGDLNELSKVGRAFISESIPDSGTAQRMFWQNILTGNLPGALIGGGIGYHQTETPGGALVGAGLGAAGGVGLPKLVQALMNSPSGQRYLTQGALPLTESSRNLLANALRLTGTAAGSSLLQNQ